MGQFLYLLAAALAFAAPIASSGANHGGPLRREDDDGKGSCGCWLKRVSNLENSIRTQCSSRTPSG